VKLYVGKKPNNMIFKLKYTCEDYFHYMGKHNYPCRYGLYSSLIRNEFEEIRNLHFKVIPCKNKNIYEVRRFRVSCTVKVQREEDLKKVIQRYENVGADYHGFSYKLIKR